MPSNFGNETCYGQDFLFKTERGRIFNFALPYPFLDKTAGGGGAGFARVKADLTNYGGLIERACDLIRHFEMDLYDNAIVPAALAHRHASISLSPGGKVLNLLLRSGLDQNRSESYTEHRGLNQSKPTPNKFPQNICGSQCKMHAAAPQILGKSHCHKQHLVTQMGQR